MRLPRWLPKATMVVAMATLLLEVALPPAAAQTYTLKIGNATLNDVQHEWQKRWGARVEKRAGGRIGSSPSRWTIASVMRAARWRTRTATTDPVPARTPPR